MNTRILLIFVFLFLAAADDLISQDKDETESGCNDKNKRCISVPKNCSQNPEVECLKLFTWQVSEDGIWLIMEIMARQTDPAALINYAAVGFSTDNRMGNEPVTECLIYQNGTALIRLSYNIGKSNMPLPDNLRKDDLVGHIKLQNFSNSNGRVYCKWWQKIQPNFDSPYVKQIPNEYNILLASGISTESGIQRHSMDRKGPSFPFISARYHLTNLTRPTAQLTSLFTRLKLIKTHAILMLIAWFLFMSTGILFARYYRTQWVNVKPMGLFIWFHIHRTLNLCGILLTVVAFICIFQANDWQWTGPSSANINFKPRALHALIGILALILCWIQPIVALFRCEPRHSKRFIFNWFHRLNGITVWFLAASTIVLAALTFDIWVNSTWALLLVIAYLIVVGVFILLNELLVCVERKRSREMRATDAQNGFEMRQHGSTKEYYGTVDGQQQNDTHSRLFFRKEQIEKGRLALITFFIVFNIVVVFILSILIILY